jgi:hypothetical protein
VPSPLKKIQERFVPEGEICNLRITSASLANNFDPATLCLNAVVIDGEYEGEPVTDYLHIQESRQNSGELYMSRKGKMVGVLKNALSTREFNELADRLAAVEMDREEWIKLIADALNNAENPVFRSVVVQNDPEDEANRRNKLTKEPEEIAPYLSPEQDQATREVVEKITGKSRSSKAKKSETEPTLSTEDEAQVEGTVS